MLLSLAQQREKLPTKQEERRRREIKYLSTYEAKQKRTKTSADSSFRTSKKNVKRKETFVTFILSRATKTVNLSENRREGKNFQHIIKVKEQKGTLWLAKKMLISPD